MKTRKEIEEMFGITRKTLEEYNRIGLVCPIQEGFGGRWYYDEDAERKLIAIRIFVEAGFQRKRIKEILESPKA